MARQGDTLTFLRIAGTQPWSVVLPEGNAVLSVTGGEVQTGGEGVTGDNPSPVELGRSGFRVRAGSDTVAIIMAPGSTAPSVPETESSR